jgi:Domain of unknown function (DUF5615)
MKVLLDENLPHDFRHHLAGHDAFTVAYMGWAGTKNGDLLRLAADAGFEAFLTMDNGVAYQQNLAKLPLAVLILSAPSNDMADLVPLVPAMLVCLSHLTPCSITRVP